MVEGDDVETDAVAVVDLLNDEGVDKKNNNDDDDGDDDDDDDEDGYDLRP